MPTTILLRSLQVVTLIALPHCATSWQRSTTRLAHSSARSAFIASSQHRSTALFVSTSNNGDSSDNSNGNDNRDSKKSRTMGRGEYYKNKYGRGGGGRGGGRGGGGRGRGRGGRGGGYQRRDNDSYNNSRGGGSFEDLRNLLRNLDSQSYGAYHDLDTPLNGNGWSFPSPGFHFYVERAQSDPFAAPTRCRVVIPVTDFPSQLFRNNPVRAMALSDYLLRSIHSKCQHLGADRALNSGGGGGRGGRGGGGGWSGPKGGNIQILEPCQHVLQQSAVQMQNDGKLVVQFSVGLPARGRTILGREADTILCSTLPSLVWDTLQYSCHDRNRLQNFVESVEDQVWLQQQLKSNNLVGFVKNGAILPRQSGVDDRPLMPPSKAVPFQTPDSLKASFTLPNSKVTIEGMGIPAGITLICGGGFHGKSTLLQTLQLGIYPKIPGDGREYCVMSPETYKIRSEDGRYIQAVDISPFITNLPFQKDTTNFSTPDASGSTSQAASIVESVELGADVLLMDEDTCATNFMIRDDKMMQLVAPNKEPITPFIHTVRSLHDDFKVSSILAIGGVGDYFDVADTVLMMDSYHCQDVTQRAKEIVQQSKRKAADDAQPQEQQHNVKYHKTKQRIVDVSQLDANGKVKVLNRNTISYSDTELDLSSVEQIVTKAQTVAISKALQTLAKTSSANAIRDVVDQLDASMDTNGLNVLAPTECNGGMARPRKLEIAASLNRLRRAKSIHQ